MTFAPKTGEHACGRALVDLHARPYRVHPRRAGGAAKVEQGARLDEYVDVAIRPGAQADLPRIAAPTLFLTGSGDRMVPPVTAVQAADRMPDAVVESIDGRGHLLHEEDPGAVAERVLDWLHRGECGLSGAS